MIHLIWNRKKKWKTTWKHLVFHSEVKTNAILLILHTPHKRTLPYYHVVLPCSAQNDTKVNTSCTGVEGTSEEVSITWNVCKHKPISFMGKREAEKKGKTWWEVLLSDQKFRRLTRLTSRLSCHGTGCTEPLEWT